MPRDHVTCKECCARLSSVNFAKIELASAARKLCRVKEARRPTYLKQVDKAKANKMIALEELERHQSECPIYNGIENAAVEEPPVRSFREMQEAFLPPYPQDHPEDGEYF